MSAREHSAPNRADAEPSLEEWRTQLAESRAGQTGVNTWTCERCGRFTATIDVAVGVTPYLLACRATPGCDGTAKSGFYPAGPAPFHVLARIEWEWYQPSGADYAALSPAMRDHVDRGGLDIRPWAGAPSAYDPDYPAEQWRAAAREKSAS